MEWTGSSTLAGLVKVAGSSCPHVCVPCVTALSMITMSFLCLLQQGDVSWMGRNCKFATPWN
jgi:hypothetical protein